MNYSIIILCFCLLILTGKNVVLAISWSGPAWESQNSIICICNPAGEEKRSALGMRSL